MREHFSPTRIITLFVLIMTVSWAGDLLFQKEPEIRKMGDISVKKKSSAKKTISRKVASHGTNVLPEGVPLKQEVLKPKLKANTTDRKYNAIDESEIESEEQTKSIASSNNSHETSKEYPIASAPATPAAEVKSRSLPVKANSNGQTLAQSTFSQGGSVTFENSTSTLPNTNNVNKPPQHTNNAGENLSCSASVPDGSYSYALSIALTCSTNAVIKYCLSEGSCCDPLSSSAKTYSSSTPIIVGENNNQYCLSFYASGRSAQADVVQKIYKINKKIPDLYVETSITWMQTTEAPINSNIISLNFGKDHHSLAQISYRSHNIGATGDNLDCEETANEMTNYVSPSPLYTLNPLSILGLHTSQQIEVPLSAASLDYGTNYIATYIVNSSKVIPTYACSISEVTLMDFPFFDSSGISSGPELIGGFTPFGFYEENFDFPRSPAGQSSSSDASQKIETAFLSVIY